MSSNTGFLMISALVTLPLWGPIAVFTVGAIAYPFIALTIFLLDRKEKNGRKAEKSLGQ